MYLLALVLPPLAILLSGRPFQAVFNGLLWFAGLVLLVLPFVPGLFTLGVTVLWALMVVHSRRRETRDRRMVDDALERERAQRIGG